MKKEYKIPFSTRIAVEFLGWVFLVGIFSGIWIDAYRWKLIFTALFAIFIAIVLTFIEANKEKKCLEN